ncbi:hypothetical protein [Streptomyces lincolnensis]|uniref:Uncharacterized protein n=1 Tax=Streptomyces lincolnensis TaxID=1915 RepID=A0A1B1MNA2_STRLN|nr:hypothetical protein [Streptomyces lincolnensis]ANS70079.1 hypothetical protein SLINC_7855 [Streptomyces lincolnensis]AXG58976.1 hypothetical protein SLCG_7821 [Streptomyces lincolnensis]QMV11579.1 hypothetical protein GJU35_41805 [Streptomyces lincolnensis]
MFQDSPIYDRLVAERGDIPLQTRREAERVTRELEFVMRPFSAFGSGLPADRPAAPGAGWQRAALPGPRPY